MRRNFFLRGSSTLVASGIQAVTFLLIARNLGPDDFGSLNALLMTTVALGTILGLGFSQRALRVAADVEPRRVVATLFVFRMVSAVLLAGTIAAVALASGFSGAAVALAACALGASEIAVDQSQHILSGFSRHVHAAAAILASRSLLAVGAAAVPFAGIGAITVAAAGASILSIALMLSYSTFPGTRLYATARSSIPFWGTSSAAVLPQFEPAVIAAASTILSGLYGAGARVISPFSSFVSAVLSVAVPSMTILPASEQRATALRLLKVAIACAASLAAASPLVASAAVFALGEAYDDSYWFIIAFVIAVGISAINQALQSFLIVRARANVAAIGVLLGGTVGLAYAFGSSQWAPPALAATPVLAQICILAYLLHGFKKELSQDE